MNNLPLSTAIPNNLPPQVTSFVGRGRELAEVRRQLVHRTNPTRLLTLTGPGGTGKTRLCLQVAVELIENFPDGVWLVELAPIEDPGLLLTAVASVLGLREEPGQPLLNTLTDYLGDKQMLILLDNC